MAVGVRRPVADGGRGFGDPSQMAVEGNRCAPGPIA